MSAEYYNKILYPLQDRVLKIFADTPFYLTGGTALSRGYYQHRYSDDLDFFVNDHPEFERLVARIIATLRRQLEPAEVVIREPMYCRLFVGIEQLKIEMINDVPSHIGDIVNHSTLGRLDSPENILANKITALVDRAHPKDVADIFFLLRDGLSLRQALLDADSKAAGITPLLVARILDEFPYQQLSAVNWIAPIDPVEIKSRLQAVALTIAEGDL